MTDKTQPEALRLALSIDLMDAFTDYQQEELNKAAAKLRRQHARIAELEAALFAYASEFEPNSDGDPDVGSIHRNIRAMKAKLASIGAGGVQALSAAPAEYVGNGMFKGETIQKAAEHWANWCDVRYMTGLSEFLRFVAASPTPPAEQQGATTGAALGVAPGVTYANKPDAVAWLAEYGGDVFTSAQLLEFADRTHALRMQAAPKAAPGEPVNGWPVEAKIYKRRDEWVLELSGVINDCAFTCRHTQPGYLQPEDVAGLPSIYSEGTAPQPAPAELEQLRERISRMGLDVDRAMRGHVNEQSPLGTQRLAAIAALAKPAPAPLSRERVKEIMRENGYDGASAQHRADFINGVRHAEIAHGISAALAARGGKA